MPDVLAAQNLPFAVALALLALLAVVQLLGLSSLLDHIDLDGDHGEADVGGGLVSLLGLGRVPLLVWLAGFLACFALLGLSIQHLAEGLLGALLPAWPATGAGLLVAVPANAVLSRLVGAIWPHDETTAVEVESLVGRRARIAVGTASRGNPARAVAYDRHGQMHNVMVAPHEADEALPEGREILLVRLEDGIFYAVEPQGAAWLTDGR